MPRRWFDPLPHTHEALDDAIEQGALFCNMLAENLKRARGFRRRKGSDGARIRRSRFAAKRASPESHPCRGACPRPGLGRVRLL